MLFYKRESNTFFFFHMSNKNQFFSQLVFPSWVCKVGVSVILIHTLIANSLGLVK